MYLSSLSMACFSIPTASRECLSGFLSQTILAFSDLTFALQESHGSSLCFPNITVSNWLAHLGLLNTSSTQTSVLQHSLPYLLFIYFCVFLRWHLCIPTLINCQGTRFHTVFCHFMCATPFSACYSSAAEAYLMATQILEVLCVWLTLCWTLKWAIGRHAIQTTQASPNFSSPY